MALCLLLAGCTNYQYHLASTGEPDRTIPTNAELVIPAAPAQLRLRQESSRCVLVIENPGSEPFTIDGAGSTIVDPSGQSRAITTRLLPAGSYLKLILPPIREVEPRGPVIGFGLGMQVDAAPVRDTARPLYLAIREGSSVEYWEWDGEDQARIILSLRQKDQTTRHEYVLRRLKK